jgi:hypothetical protein
MRSFFMKIDISLNFPIIILLSKNSVFRYNIDIE